MPQNEIAVQCNDCGMKTTGDESLIGTSCMCRRGTFERIDAPPAPTAQATGEEAVAAPVPETLEPGRTAKPSAEALFFGVFTWDNDTWNHQGTQGTKEEADSLANTHRDKWTKVIPIHVGL